MDDRRQCNKEGVGLSVDSRSNKEGLEAAGRYYEVINKAWRLRLIIEDSAIKKAWVDSRSNKEGVEVAGGL